MKITKIFVALLLFTPSFFLFNFFEFGPLNQGIDKSIQSLMLSFTVVLAFLKPKFRIKLFFISFILLFFTVVFYLTGNLLLSNSFASIGIGMLLFVSLSYLPQLFKKGYIDNL